MSRQELRAARRLAAAKQLGERYPWLTLYGRPVAIALACGGAAVGLAVVVPQVMDGVHLGRWWVIGAGVLVLVALAWRAWSRRPRVPRRGWW